MPKFGFSFDELDDMDRMFQELGLENGDSLFEQEEYDPYDPTRRRKEDEFDLDGVEDTDSLLSPDALLEDLFREFDQFVADRPYLFSEQDERDGDTDFFDGGGEDDDDDDD